MKRSSLAYISLAIIPILVGCVCYQWSRNFQLSVILTFASCFVVSDVWYFIRLLVYRIRIRTHHTNVFDSDSFSSWVALTSIDRNGHFTNSRYLRELGFARLQFWKRNGMWDIIKANGGNLIVSSQSIRYRRELGFGQTYTIQTRLLGWDSKAFYLEHRFVRHSTKVDFVHAIVLVKNAVIGNVSPQTAICLLLKCDLDSPSFRADLAAWVQYDTLSSQTLRNEKNITT
uniref:Uncharacterized protein AlNc14C19G1993 n=1 Tax=Albugo laibachii Nc14 TaxID=890382 RepID=F0W522_9STRA|nr:conserved hypothetical protein [Albugo laibachii Nc14]|eukprot:CCA16213.1 conserved hypothetical protein [Albugo laibachii Nc14]